MVDLMTIIYYQDEYKNTKSLEAKEYLDATLAALIDYAKHIRHLILISKPVLSFLKMRVKMSYGDRLEYQRLFNAYDKEYDEPYSPQGRAYREKLIQKCERYRGLANFYYIFDEHNLLNKKDAPCDKGQEVISYWFKTAIQMVL